MEEHKHSLHQMGMGKSLVNLERYSLAEKEVQVKREFEAPVKDGVHDAMDVVGKIIMLPRDELNFEDMKGVNDAAGYLKESVHGVEGIHTSWSVQGKNIAQSFKEDEQPGNKTLYSNVPVVEEKGQEKTYDSKSDTDEEVDDGNNQDYIGGDSYDLDAIEENISGKGTTEDKDQTTSRHTDQILPNTKIKNITNDLAIKGYYECEYCKMKFHTKQKRKWLSHMKSCSIKYHDSNKFVCSQCEKQFSTVYSLIRHKKMNCYNLVDNTRDLEEKRVTDEKGTQRYQCKNCPLNFSTLKGFMSHKKHCEKFVCGGCNFEFRSKYGLDKHLSEKVCEKKKKKKHSSLCISLQHKFDEEEEEMQSTWGEKGKSEDIPSERLLKCDFCPQHFKTKHILSRHKKTCTKAMYKYACKLCGKLFRKKNGCLGHLDRDVCQQESKESRQKQAEKGTHMCDICGKCFSHRATLTTHKHFHTGAKSVQCQVCSKTFWNVTMYNRHMIMHTGEKKFVCQYCGKAFPRKVSLSEHEVQHTGHGRLQCPYCSKMFHEKATLRLHVRMHTGEKPYQCRFCDKAFAKTPNRKVHETLIHTKDFPHSCPHCSKGFVARNAMNKHAEDCSLNRNRKTMF